jgi:Phage integrase family
LKVLRILCDYAININMLTRNPAMGVKRYKSKPDGFHTWSETEILQFEAAYPVSTKERLAFALAIYTAQRVSDLVLLLIPLHPDLAQVLASVPRINLTFLTTEHGAPFAPASLSNWFGKRCRAAGLTQCTAHGLRKAACRRLAEAGATVHEIAAVSGHRSLGEVERYTRYADQARLAGQALERQLRAEREQLLSNLETRLDKTGEKG